MRYVLSRLVPVVLLASTLTAVTANDGPTNSVPSSDARAKKLTESINAGHIVLLDTPSVLASDGAAFSAVFPRSGAVGASRMGAATVASEGATAPAAVASPAAVSDMALKLYNQHQAVLSDILGESAASSALSTPAALSPEGAASVASAATPAFFGGPRVSQQFAYVANGFSVTGLNEDQLRRLRARPDVRSVTPNRFATPLTVTTPAFLKLSGAGGVWETQFGGQENAGQGTVIGVIDTGSTPSSTSFASPGGPASPSAPELGDGACSEAGTCTPNKLVGCRYFQDSFVAAIASDPTYTAVSSDLNSCKDTDGHGTHTSSTAAGDGGAVAWSGSGPLGDGRMSGMAPAAAVAVYKALWYVTDKATNESFPTGVTADIIAAVEKAVLDGVDVISFSLGFGVAPQTVTEEPMYEAFRAAAAAGVVIAAAAGNSGDAAGTTETNLPFVISVAAGTHDRAVTATATVNGQTYNGASSSSSAVGPSPLYYAGASNSSQSLCFDGALPDEAAGKIVLCMRGENDRVAKSKEVARVGGLGMILANVAGGLDNLEADAHSVPTVHVNAADGAAILASYTAAPTASTAALSARRVETGIEAPSVAGFSSRGPAACEGGALLKPDIMAPGVNVFAAMPASKEGNDTGQMMSGTSMATPHIAGIAALIKALRPTWSPMAIKSALMTSASLVTNKGNPITGNPFDYGAGHVDVARALDPGLVYDSGPDDWDRYACAATSPRPSSCKALCKPSKLCSKPQGLRDFNAPSFAFPGVKCRGRRTVKARRTVTFVGTGSGDFTPQVSLPPGFKGAVTIDTRRQKGMKARPQRSKGSLQGMAPGATRTFTLSVTVAKGASGWQFGQLVWSDGGSYTVRSPIAIECK